MANASASSAANAHSLSMSQQDAVAQYLEITDDRIENAVLMLQRSGWDVQNAVSRFYDGDIAAPAGSASTIPADRHLVPRKVHHERAPRVVAFPVQEQRVSFPFSLAIIPLVLIKHTLSTLFTVICPFNMSHTGIVPLRHSLSEQALTTAAQDTMPNHTPSANAAWWVKQLAREAKLADIDLPLFAGSFAAAYDEAKRDLKFLLVILLSPEHDDTHTFVLDTLLDSAVTNVWKENHSPVIIWIGNVCEPEAYQLSQEYSCTSFPWSALLCMAAGKGGNHMSIIKKLSGDMTPYVYASQLQTSMESHMSELTELRNHRSNHERTRNLRSAQDEAYERSLAADRELARKRKEADAALRAANEAKEKAAANAQARAKYASQWKRWRASRIVPEPPASTPGTVRLAIKLLSGERVVRRFDPKAPIEEVYAFVECLEQVDSNNDEISEVNPEIYTHEYNFRLVTILPRKLFLPTDTGTLVDMVGRSGNLVVEDIEDTE